MAPGFSPSATSRRITKKKDYASPTATAGCINALTDRE